MKTVRSAGLRAQFCSLLCAVFGAATSIWHFDAQAQSFPSKPLRFVVCTPAGGQIDILARLTSEKLQTGYGQAIVVENKPGAAGRIAAQDILKSPADGHTVMFCGIQIVTMPLFFKEPGYELGKDLLSPAILMDNASTVAIAAGVPAKNLKEFVAYAKANPGKLNYVSYGNHHITLAIENFMQAEGFTMTPIPFAGTAPMQAAMGQGDLHFGINTVTVLKPMADRGALRLIATVAPQRTTTAPDVPTAAESGYPGFIVPSWFGTFGRGGTPREILEKLNRDLNGVVRMPDVKTKLEAMDAAPMNLTLDETAREIAAKYQFFEQIAARLKIEKQ